MFLRPSSAITALDKMPVHMNQSLKAWCACLLLYYGEQPLLVATFLLTTCNKMPKLDCHVMVHIIAARPAVNCVSVLLSALQLATCRQSCAAMCTCLCMMSTDAQAQNTGSSMSPQELSA